VTCCEPLLTSFIFDVRVVRRASNCRIYGLYQIMPPATWNLSSILLISTGALCLSPSIRALHPLTKLVLATAVWQLLRLDQQLHKDEVPARPIHDIRSTCPTGMRCERVHPKALRLTYGRVRQRYWRTQKEHYLRLSQSSENCRWRSRNDVELTSGRGNAEILCQCKSFLEVGHVRSGSLKGVLVMLE
jgi:hypothetical protein